VYAFSKRLQVSCGRLLNYTIGASLPHIAYDSRNLSAEMGRLKMRDMIMRHNIAKLEIAGQDAMGSQTSVLERWKTLLTRITKQHSIMLP